MPLYAIDGTLSERRHLSNVYYFAKRYRDPTGRKAAYFSGPGTPAASLGLGISGALFGTGSRRLAQQVLDRIAEDTKHNRDLPIDLVGFSRGAAIANEVAWLLGTLGILRERTDNSSLRDMPTVRFLGLFDPVHSMGFPIPTFSGPVFLGNRRWCSNKIPENVKHATVIVAQDERRELFRPSNLVELPRRGHFYGRLPVSGDHSDAGGHVENNRVLAMISLREMVRAAVDAGVEMNTEHLITDAEIAVARAKGMLDPSAGVGVGPRPWARW
jgi:uncharacterized protein (DUF2235 family)